MQHVLQSIEKQVDYLQMSGDIQCADYANKMLLSMLCTTWACWTSDYNKRNLCMIVYNCINLYSSL